MMRCLAFPQRGGRLLLASLYAIALVAANDPVAVDGVGPVSVVPERVVPSWVTPNEMRLKLSTSPGQFLPANYTVVPLTENMGLNQSTSSRTIISIPGDLTMATASNYLNLQGLGIIAYVSCDPGPNSSLIQPNQILNTLVNQDLSAIILYSISQSWCSLSDTSMLSYQSMLSMVSSAEAAAVQSYVNGSHLGTGVSAAILGNVTVPDASSSSSGSSESHTPAVAMSILYCITGLIVLLFAVIIAIGVVRAHRYPERYGPRRGSGGLLRQSRAKGLARAMLDTIPVVKFGNQGHDKVDPQLEMEAANTMEQEVARQPDASALDEAGNPEMTSAVFGPEEPSADNVKTERSRKEPEVQTVEDGHLGCSICTDDFKVGEDVRILPCNHQFHALCVDPWLVNVSGTCPLCRYDLHPHGPHPDQETSPEENGGLPPPLTLEGEGDSSTLPSGTGHSRLLDAVRMPHATPQERMEALRRMRVEDQGGEGINGEPAAQQLRFSAKLREKFRIRTRAQSGRYES